MEPDGGEEPGDLLIVLNGIEIGVRAGDGHPLQLLIVLNGIEI